MGKGGAVRTVVVAAAAAAAVAIYWVPSQLQGRRERGMERGRVMEGGRKGKEGNR